MKKLILISIFTLISLFTFAQMDVVGDSLIIYGGGTFENYVTMGLSGGIVNGSDTVVDANTIYDYVTALGTKWTDGVGTLSIYRTGLVPGTTDDEDYMVTIGRLGMTKFLGHANLNATDYVMGYCSLDSLVKPLKLYTNLKFEGDSITTTDAVVFEKVTTDTAYITEFTTESLSLLNTSVVVDTIETTLTDSDTKIPTSRAVYDYVSVKSKDISFGESYMSNYRSKILDDGGTYYPNSGGYEIGRLKSLGLWWDANFVFLPSATETDSLFVVKPFDNKFTVTNGAATRINSDGYIENTEAGVARIDYSDGDAALLLEPADTNLITYPISFGNAYWTKSGSSVVSGQSSPHVDYPTDAFKLVESSGGTIHSIQKAGISISAATYYTHSVYAKKGERNWIFMYAFDGTTSRKSWFDLDNGVVGSTPKDCTQEIDYIIDG